MNLTQVEQKLFWNKGYEAGVEAERKRNNDTMMVTLALEQDRSWNLGMSWMLDAIIELLTTDPAIDGKTTPSYQVTPLDDLRGCGCCSSIDQEGLIALIRKKFDHEQA